MKRNNILITSTLKGRCHTHQSKIWEECTLLGMKTTIRTTSLQVKSNLITSQTISVSKRITTKNSWVHLKVCSVIIWDQREETLLNMKERNFSLNNFTSHLMMKKILMLLLPFVEILLGQLNSETTKREVTAEQMHKYNEYKRVSKEIEVITLNKYL